MLKVFLVEDEFVIREGIKNNIDWKAHGYEFCGEAGDGELAYPMIQKLRPDIVITDIRIIRICQGSYRAGSGPVSVQTHQW